MKRWITLLIFSGASSALAQTSLGIGASYNFLTGGGNLSNQSFSVHLDQGGFLVGSRIEAGLQQGNNPGFNVKAAVTADVPATMGFKLKVGAGPELLRDTKNNGWVVSGYVFVSPEFELALGLSAFAEVAYSKVLFTDFATPDNIGVKAGVRFTF